MKEYKIMAKQIASHNIIRIFDFAIMFALLIVLTRFLTKSQFGIYSILNITILFTVGLFSLGIPSFIMRALAGIEKKARIRNFNKLFNFYVLYVPLLALVLSILAWLILTLIGYTDMIIPTISAFTIAGIGIFIYAIQNNLKTEKKIITSKIIGSLFEIVWALPVITLLFLYAANVTDIFLLRFVYSSIIFAAILFYYFRKKVLFLERIDRRYIKKALVFGVPLSTVMISRWVLTASDRYILGFFHGAVDVANYSYVYTLLGMLGLTASSIGLTIGPYFISEYNKRNKEKSKFLLNASFKYQSLILIPAITGFFILSREIITMVSGVKYLTSAPIIPFLLLFPFLDLMKDIYVNVHILKNKTKRIAGIYFIGIIINLVLNFVLIPKFSSIGAAIATTVSYLILFMFFYIPSRETFRLNHSFVRLPRIILSTAVMAFSIIFIHPQTIFTKLAVICFGAIIYLISLYLTKVFVKEEIVLIKSFIPNRRKN
ncbi:oligosaccharide flippase family protein [Candidatus Woesearchaeota archaeon]|nr:oligosaccharide flippase family protein [Candidatus Woesearchaeota archaeon]